MASALNTQTNLRNVFIQLNNWLVDDTMHYTDDITIVRTLYVFCVINKQHKSVAKHSLNAIYVQYTDKT